MVVVKAAAEPGSLLVDDIGQLSVNSAFLLEHFPFIDPGMAVNNASFSFGSYDDLRVFS